MTDKYFLTGDGAREHAIAWALQQADSAAEIFCCPGNAGIAQIAECLPVADDDIRGLLRQIRRIQPTVTIAGPEAGLANGLGDRVRSAGFKFVGPGRKAARLEASKVWANWLMNQVKIPKPTSVVFTNPNAAVAYVLKKGPAHVVIKADGLCGGKGVILPKDGHEAAHTITGMLSGKMFGKAGKRIVVQERLSRREVSVIAVTDGTNILLLPSAQDYKRRFEDDLGPNTGGMGAQSPNPRFPGYMADGVIERVIRPVLEVLKIRLGVVYNGFLYVGLMIGEDDSGVVLEFNVRLGDPEASVILPLWTGNVNFAELMQATADDNLAGIRAYPQQDAAVCAVLVSAGYPGSYETNRVITGLDEAARLPNVLIFHAGTKQGEDGQILATGGRALDVVGIGPTNQFARDRMYAAARRIQFQGCAMRSDIGV